MKNKFASLLFVSWALIGFGEIRGMGTEWLVGAPLEIATATVEEAAKVGATVRVAEAGIRVIPQSLLRRLPGMAFAVPGIVFSALITTSGRALTTSGRALTETVIAVGPTLIQNYIQTKFIEMAALTILEKYNEAKKPNYITSTHNPQDLNPLLVVQNPAIQKAIEHALLAALPQEGGNRILPQNTLLLGPPGTGKSESVKHIAKNSGLPLVEVSGEDLLQKNSSSNHIRTTFTSLKQEPCIIHLQDADVLFKPREQMTEKERNIANAILNVLDRNDNYPQRATFILSTNLPFKPNDDAIARRFPQVIKFELPDVATAQEVFKYHAQRLGFSMPDEQIALFAQHAVDNKLSHSRIQAALESLRVKSIINKNITSETVLDCLDAARPQLFGNTNA